MLDTPALDILLAGVEEHPEATLGQLLAFMSAYNLRFGEATTPTQKAVYDSLYPKLAELRAEVAPALAGASPPKTTGNEVGDFFSAMDYKDLQKKAPPASTARGRYQDDPAHCTSVRPYVTWRADNASPGRPGND